MQIPNQMRIKTIADTYAPKHMGRITGASRVFFAGRALMRARATSSAKFQTLTFLKFFLEILFFGITFLESYGIR